MKGFILPPLTHTHGQSPRNRVRIRIVCACVCEIVCHHDHTHRHTGDRNRTRRDETRDFEPCCLVSSRPVPSRPRKAISPAGSERTFSFSLSPFACLGKKELPSHRLFPRNTFVDGLVLCMSLCHSATLHTHAHSPPLPVSLSLFH